MRNARRAHRLIIAEDEPLIALEIEQIVTDAGCVVVGMAYTLSETIALLDGVPCDGVVLDANLRGQSADSIIERLHADNLPYILVSGYGRDQLGFADNHAPLVGKPFVADELIAAIRKHLMLAKP